MIVRRLVFLFADTTINLYRFFFFNVIGNEDVSKLVIGEPLNVRTINDRVLQETDLFMSKRVNTLCLMLIRKGMSCAVSLCCFGG